MSQRENDAITDERFSSARSDPRFKRVPRKVRKIEIDNRFAGMFEEDRFQVNYTSDKRGRTMDRSASEDLKRFYHLEKGDTSAAELVCRSRGEVQVESSGSDSDTDEEDTTFGSGGVNEELIHAWAELDRSAETTDASTSRLAVCTMDWDRVTANDILLLFSSLTPEQGRVLSVKVFPSEYGRDRIRAEDAEGPEELLGGEGEGEGDSEALQTERLRKYQLNRLLYYYAIVETDNSATSDYLYQLCNGTEYELSGTLLDIRVVPDGMQFEDATPTSVATPDTLPPDYLPSSFQNSALQHTKVQLTWDETDPARRKVLNQNFSKADIRELDFQAYLASGTESDESVGEGREENEEQTISKFRSLLTELESRESTEHREEVDLEITWEPGKLAPLEEAISKKGKREAGLTPWEEYVKKRKEKKKMKRNKNKKQECSSEEGDESKYESAFTELGGKKKKSKPSKSVALTESEEKEREQLQLLMVSDSESEGGEKKHFNMNEIWKNNKLSEKKKRKLARRGKLVQGEDFKLDLTDSRFERLLESPNYAPDPSDPQFHQGRGLKEIIEERKRRREVDISQGGSSKEKKIGRDNMRSREQLEMSALVRKLKQKSEFLQTRKANRFTKK